MAEADVPESLPLVDNSNPLRQYRSYSYHFFVIAAESTDVFTYLQNQNANAFERTHDAAKLPNGAIDQPYPRNAITCPAGNYVIVIDTRHDVDFILDDVQWGTSFIGDITRTNSTTPLNTVMTDGMITILEPRGVNFLNVLAALGDQLLVDMICMTYMLKVIFYGHLEDGTMVPLSAIQPLGFIPVDITGSVDERGSTYKMSIVGTVNGIGFNPVYDAVVDNIPFKIYKKPIAQVFADITKTLNDNYQDQRRQVCATYPTFNDSAQIEYNISLDSGSEVLYALNDFGSQCPGQVSESDKAFTVTGTKEGGIIKVIQDVINSSAHWVTLAAEGSPPNATSIQHTNKRYTFKVTTEFKKTSLSLGKNVVTMNIYVTEYKYETVDVVSTAGGSRAKTEVPNIDPDKVITYDYLFTGKNLDILHMDINLTQGLSLLQTLSTARALSPQLEDTQGGPAPTGQLAQVGPTPNGGLNKRGVIRPGTPVFAPLQWKDDYQKELANIDTTATASSVWSSFAGYQSVNTNVTIHGNPLLLTRLVNPARDVPNYVQINIKMPSTPDDIWEYNQSGNATPGGYYQSFWYTGYYVMLSASNKFNNGQFTQDLELVSMPLIGSSQGQGASAEQQATQNNTSQFHPQTSQSTPTATTTPTNDTTSTPSTNTNNTIAKPTSNPKSSSHQQFIANYWNDALQASQVTGLDPDFVLAQAAVESGWGTSHLSTTYSNFFGARAYNKPNQFWDGSVVPGTNHEAGNVVKPFRAYQAPTGSFGDQHDLLTRLYPQSASAPPGPSGINQYANGLIHGKGGRKWTATNPSAYPGQVISAYNAIQTYKNNLGIVANNYYGTPPTATPTSQAYLAQNTSSSSAGTTTPANVTQYATNRSVAQAAVDQKQARA